jgi:hypothetical protein
MNLLNDDRPDDSTMISSISDARRCGEVVAQLFETTEWPGGLGKWERSEDECERPTGRRRAAPLLNLRALDRNETTTE